MQSKLNGSFETESNELVMAERKSFARGFFFKPYHKNSNQHIYK